MKNNTILWGLTVLLLLTALCSADPFELGTVIEKKGSTVMLSGSGYTRLSLVRFKTGNTGTLYLKGSVAVNLGSANLVMWAKVNGKFYFTRLPGLQNLRDRNANTFSIPFSSPKDPVTEVVLEIEMPEGGRVTLDHLNISIQTKKQTKQQIRNR